MRYFVGLLVGIVCFQISVQADTPWDNSWTDGQIVLKDGSVLKGKLRYNLENDVVVMQTKEQLRAFGVHSVELFTLNDTTKGVVQYYYTLPYQEYAQRPQLRFFKLVFEDSFALFVREKEVSRNALRLAKTPMRIHPSKDNLALLQKYYVLLPDGSFQKFRVRHRDIAEVRSLEENGSNQISRYIYENDIDLRRQTDIIRLIHHFVSQEYLVRL